MKLSKGAHTPIPTSLLAVVVSWRSEHVVDAHALLLDEGGTVRDDKDLVFYNAPRHISQAVTLDQDPAPGTARLSVSLPRTRSDVDRIVVSGSVDDAVFADLGEVRVTVYAVDGPVAELAVTDSESVTAMMFGEFYRRDGGWRFRAVGQGWATGMAGLVTEFGVRIDEPAAASGAGAARRTPRDTSSAGSPAATGTSRDAAGGSDAETPDSDRHTAVITEEAPAERERAASRRTGDLPAGAARATAQHGGVRGATSRRDSGEGTRRTAEHHPGVAHYQPDEHSGGPTASGGRLSDGHANRPAAGTVTLRRLAAPEPPLPPPASGHADWYRDPEDHDRLRWWDGAHWTGERRPTARPHPHDCDRCGARRRRRIFGGQHPCGVCAAQTREFLTHWHTRAARVLNASGPRGSDWDALWTSLRYQRIDAAEGRAALESVAWQYVERRVAFAFADGEISAEEYDDFDHAITELRVHGPLIDELRTRMLRGRALSGLREGDLPTVQVRDLHLDAEELVYLDIDATHIRELARGPKNTDGRLIASTKKLRFTGPGTGIEIPWSRIVSVAAEHDTVVVSATSARGGAMFAVADAEQLAAALEGALRVAKRLVLAPGQRDSRSISQEIKAQVWQRDGGRCVQCSESHYLEFDHIIPLSRGGATSAGNLQILCRGCNREKGANI